MSYQRSVNLVHAQTTTRNAAKKEALKYEQSTKQITHVSSADIRDTQKFQKVGNTFIDEMFAILPKLGQTEPKSSVAINSVVSAFLGATFGGDRDEGVPTFKLESKDFIYSKSPDGSGLGFGTIKYQLAKQKLTLTLLMHIQDDKIVSLQTGKVVDTTGKGK